MGRSVNFWQKGLFFISQKFPVFITREKSVSELSRSPFKILHNPSSSRHNIQSKSNRTINIIQSRQYQFKKTNYRINFHPAIDKKKITIKKHHLVFALPEFPPEKKNNRKKYKLKIQMGKFFSHKRMLIKKYI